MLSYFLENIYTGPSGFQSFYGESGVILIDLPLYATWSFVFAAFNILTLFLMFVLITNWQGDILWPTQFGVL